MENNGMTELKRLEQSVAREAAKLFDLNGIGAVLLPIDGGNVVAVGSLGAIAKVLPKDEGAVGDDLRKRVAELEAARMAYASEFPLNTDGEPDVGSIHSNIRALKAKVAAQPVAASAAGLEGLTRVDLIPATGGGMTLGSTDDGPLLWRADVERLLATQSAKQGAQPDLHDAIMNLRCDASKYDAVPSERLAYKNGHRDARHAAAELALSTMADSLPANPAQVPPDARDQGPDVLGVLKECADALAYVAYNYDGSKLEDLNPNMVESTGASDTALIAERRARAAIRALMKSGSQSKGEGETQ